VHNYNLSPQIDDEEIYNLAVKENRFVVTIDNDFKRLVKRNKSGVIIIPAELSNEGIDKILTKFISEKDPKDYMGKVTKVGFGS